MPVKIIQNQKFWAESESCEVKVVQLKVKVLPRRELPTSCPTLPSTHVPRLAPKSFQTQSCIDYDDDDDDDDDNNNDDDDEPCRLHPTPGPGC